MPSIDDAIVATLIAAGYAGNVSSGLLQWAKANGATSNSLPDAIHQVLVLQGATEKLSLNDAWHTVLAALSYTGTINDQQRSFWLAGGVFSGLPANVITESGLAITESGIAITET